MKGRVMELKVARFVIEQNLDIFPSSSMMHFPLPTSKNDKHTCEHTAL